MAEHLKNCCSLKRASAIIGVVYTVLSLVLLGFLLIILCQTEYNALRTFGIVAVCFCAIEAILGILLVIGSFQKIPALVMTWVVYHGVTLVLRVSEHIYIFFATGEFNRDAFIVTVVVGALTICCMLVVNRYHTEITKVSQDFRTLEDHQLAQGKVV